MHKESEVWPDLVNVLHLVMVNNHFHTHLAPGGHANNETNIPFRGLLYNFIQLFIPIFHFGNLASGLVKSLEPEGTILSQNSTEVAGKPTSFSFLKIRSTSQHQESFSKRSPGKFI